MTQKHKADTTRQQPAPTDRRAAPPAISPSRASPAALTAADRALDADTTAMRARITVAGAQPPTRDGWLLVWAAIRHASTPHDREGRDETRPDAGRADDPTRPVTRTRR